MRILLSIAALVSLAACTPPQQWSDQACLMAENPLASAADQPIAPPSWFGKGHHGPSLHTARTPENVYDFKGCLLDNSTAYAINHGPLIIEAQDGSVTYAAMRATRNGLKEQP